MHPTTTTREEILALLSVEKFYQSYIESGLVSKGNEFIARCPFHKDLNPSFSINQETGLWKCFAGCGGGSPIDFLMKTHNVDFKEAFAILRRIVGFDRDDIEFEHAKAQPKSQPPPKPERTEDAKPAIPEDAVRVSHERLLGAPDMLKFLHERRGLSLGTIKRFKIGWDGDRYTIPIRNEKSRLRNIRRYKPNAMGKDKMISFAQFDGHKKVTYGQARLFPLPVKGDFVVFCEGEMDCMVAIQEGFNAITATSGAGTFNPAWAPLFKGKDVVVAFDNDTPGRVGGQNVAKNLLPHAKSVRILNWPLSMANKGDITDWFVNLGETVQSFQRLVDAAEPYQPAAEAAEAEAKEVKVSEASLAEFTGKAIKMTAMVSGKDTTPFITPRKINAWCDQNNGDACQTCGMQIQFHGKAEIEFTDKNRETMSLLNCSDKQQKMTICSALGIRVRCNRWGYEIKEHMNVEQVYVIPEISGKLQQNEEGEYVTRTVYAIKHGVKTNAIYKFKGFAYADSRDQKSTALFGKATEAEISIDKFELSKKQIEALSVFKPSDGQSVRAKMHEIARELEKVHRIRGRETLQMVYDLGWHSILNFNCFGQYQPKGWVEVFVVGDSGQGKTTMFLALTDWYRAGQRVQAEQSSSAGLIGGLTKREDNWVINWGPVVLNDRRLLGLDEWSGVSEADAERMTDVRSTGIAEIVKIHREKAYARTRLVFMSNPRDGRPLSSYEHGVESIRTLFKKSEDVRRIDIAVAVQSGDVKLEVLNVVEEANLSDTCKLSSDDCAALVMWAWSRKKEHVVIISNAQQMMIEGAFYLSTKYTSHIPLIEPADVRWKLARLSVATAARLFSTGDGLTVNVEEAHVGFVIALLDEIYSSPSMGYSRYSARRNAAEQWVQNNKLAIVQGLKDLVLNPSELVELLMNETWLSMHDMEFQLGIERAKVKQIILFLTKHRCIQRASRGYRKTPSFITLLREIEDTVLPSWKADLAEEEKEQQQHHDPQVVVPDSFDEDDDDFRQ